MAALALYLIFATVLCGFLAVIFFFREERLRKQLHERDRLQRHKYYEVAILKEIQDRIGYSLDLEKVIEVIQGSLKYFLSYSSTSALIIKDDRVIFKTLCEEPINPMYLEQIKNSMFTSITAITERPLPMTLDTVVTGVTNEHDMNVRPISSFHIPLFIHNTVVALINVSSKEPNLYKETEVTALTQIANQASKALSKLQEVLAIEKGKLMAMIGSLVDGVFMIDTSNHLLIINEAAKDYLNLKKTDLSLNDVMAAFSGSFDLRTKIAQSISENRVIMEKEIQLNGRTMQVFITPVLKPTQTGVYYTKEQEKHGIIGASILLHDITLEKSVTKMKEDFTNMMVHELRAPLTAMKDSAHLMLTMSNLDADDTSKLLTIIHDQSQRLLEDVTSLLDAAKLEAGRFTIEKTPSDIKNIVRERIQFFTPQAQTKHMQIIANINEHVPVAAFDPLRMTQVMNNLLSNALKYTPNAGKITVSIDTDGKALSVSVADTGAGIPKEKQGVLFSKFGQIMSSVGNGTTHLSGTGLGLYITKGIVEAHGGTISLDSEVGKGTKVTVTIPINLDHAATQTSHQQEHEKPLPPAPPLPGADQSVHVTVPLPQAIQHVN
jgi:signal transduction histidine kinase